MISLCLFFVRTSLRSFFDREVKCLPLWAPPLLRERRELSAYSCFIEFGPEIAALIFRIEFREENLGLGLSFSLQSLWESF